METHKQTWWDKEIKAQFNEFKSWVGGPQSQSKKEIRDYIKSKKYTSIADIGCGMCDDFFIYKNEQPEVSWIGIEPSQFLFSLAKEKQIPVVNKEGHETHFFDEGVQVAYSRHVLEHQKDYKPILSEMIRIASEEVIHIFFIPPRDKEIINYNPDNNLYHNTYDRNEMESFLKEHPKVDDWNWKKIGATEEALIISIKKALD